MAGPFTTVIDLDKGWKKNKLAFRELKKWKAVAGVFAGRKHPSGMSSAQVAAIHEFGSPTRGIPPRAFMKRAFAQGLSRNIAHMKAIYRGATGPSPVPVKPRMLELAQIMSNDMRVAISGASGWAPGLKTKTIRQKGHGRPLVDTGSMVDSITGRVATGRFVSKARAR